MIEKTIELSNENKIRVACMALENVVSAPLLLSERDSMCNDALYLIRFGFYKEECLGEWGRRIAHMLKSE